MRPPYQLNPEQLAEATRRALDSTGDVSRLAAERFAGTMAVKARLAKREVTRAARAGAPAEQAAGLALRAKGLALRAEATRLEARLVGARASLAAVVGHSPAAYGRVVDAHGAARAEVPVALVNSEGETLARGVSDAEGVFAVAAPPGETDVHLVVGETRHMVARAGQPMAPRAFTIRHTARSGG